MTYKTQKTFTEFKDSVCSKFHAWGASDADFFVKKKVNYYFWDNTNLYPEHNAITDRSTVITYLRHAKRHGTLEQIHNYIDPLAFTVQVGRKGNPFTHYHTYTFECYNLSIIRFIADASVRFRADAGDILVINVPSFEYEVWGRSCGKNHWSPLVYKKMCGFFNESL